MSATTNYQIEVPSKKDYKAIVDVWEASVSATHHFLREEDIQFFKPLILTGFLDAVQLHCIKIDSSIVAFLGTSSDKIEMLFIHPAHHRKGLGKRLLFYAIHQLDKKLVDVNEQNQQAVSFYKHLGFDVAGWSSVDGMGKPYPILYMKLKQKRLH